MRAAVTNPAELPSALEAAVVDVLAENPDVLVELLVLPLAGVSVGARSPQIEGMLSAARTADKREVTPWRAGCG